MAKAFIIAGHVLAGLCVLLSILAAGCWRRSAVTADYVSWWSSPSEGGSGTAYTGFLLSRQGKLDWGSDWGGRPYTMEEQAFLGDRFQWGSYPADELKFFTASYYLEVNGKSPPTFWNRLGFYWEAYTQLGWTIRNGAVPHWFASICLLPPPLLWLLWRRRRRAVLRRRRWLASGLCGTCGYDLRAHCPGQRCPECGTEIPLPPPGAPPRPQSPPADAPPPTPDH